MRHSFITLLIIASVLFVGVENVFEEILDDHAVSSTDIQMLDGHSSSAELDGDTHHCGHCFHSHAGNIVHTFESPVIPTNTALLSYREPNLLAYIQAPPTPPPNA